MSIDQPILRPVACFDDSEGATATQAFLYQNQGTYDQSVTMGDAVSRTLFGVTQSLLPLFVSSHVSSLVSVISSILGSNSNLNLRYADNSIPFMIGLHCSLNEENENLFNDSVFMESWSNAAATSTRAFSEDSSYITSLRETV